MKKALLAVIGAGVVASMASLAFADDDAAYSANAVGVIKYTIPAGGALTCIALPLNPMENGVWYWPETSLATQLDRGSTVHFWNGTGWRTTTKQRSGWSDEEALLQPANAIKAGQAFFVQGPSTATEEKVISLLGELPVDGTQELTLTGSNNLDMTAITTYPVAKKLSDSAFADLDRGSLVYKWDGSKWQMSTKQRSSWSEDLEFEVGEGSFVELNGTGRIVEEERPYQW